MPLFSFKRLLCSPLLLLSCWVAISLPTLADTTTYTDFNDYRVQHTVFNSTFLQPDVAAAYGLVRGDGKLVVNIALLKKRESGAGYTLGQPAQLKGRVSNLMQQSKPLEFREIKEQDATYYLASLRIDSSEEVLHFDITLTQGERTFDLSFDKKLYDQ